MITVSISNVNASTVVEYGVGGLRSVPPATNIIRTLKTNDGYLYFSYVDTSNATGIARLNPIDDSVVFYKLMNSSPSFFSASFIVDFALRGNEAWILTTDFSTLTYLQWLNLTDNKLLSWPVGGSGMSVQDDHSIWLTGSFLRHFNPESGELKTYPIPTNYSTLFRPIFVQGKVWAIAMHFYPLPAFSGDTLMMFDPSSETMTFYRLPVEFVYDMTADDSGNLWLISHNQLLRFNTLSKECFIVQSSYGGWRCTCDKEGNVYFVLQGGTEMHLMKFSPSEGSFTDYWKTTNPSSDVVLLISDIATEDNGNVWFIEIRHQLGEPTTVERLFRLSTEAPNVIETSTSFSSLSTIVEAIPSASLTYTLERTTTKATQSTTSLEHLESTFIPILTTTITETKVVDELSPYMTLALSLGIAVPILMRRKFERKNSPSSKK